MNKPTTVPSLVRAAHVRREHGVEGVLAVTALGGDARRFRKGLQLVNEATGEIYTVESARQAVQDEVLLRLVGIDNRETAQRLRDAYLCVAGDAIRSLGKDEWFVWQLVGLRVQDPNGSDIGVVTDVEETPAHDLLVVDGEGQQHLFPMVSAFVADVNLDSGVVTVTPWEWEAD